MGTKRSVRKKNGHVAPADEPRLPVPIREEGELRRRRMSTVKRRTSKLDVTAALDLDGSGRSEASTSDARLDQLLTYIAAEAVFDLKVVLRGSGSRAEIYSELGAALGRAFDEAAGERELLVRAASASVPVGESIATVHLDLMRRAHASVTLVAGAEDADLFEVFLRSFVAEGALTAHVVGSRSSNALLSVESAARALGFALASATRVDPRKKRVP
ncbi:MAG: hypothetical protein HYV07_03955 [Deltaproteobacteria bacterium]|nr:hypothetical protein [Deltaproteobacteria bacterium]